LSYQKIALAGEWDKKSVIPYNLVSFNELFGFFKYLKNDGLDISVFGYWGKPTDLAVTPANEVFMTSILIEKNNAQPEIRFLGV
jgi:hypothetical protein